MTSKRRLITIANGLTLSRVLFLPVIVYYLVTGQRFIAFLFICVSLLTDTIDGFIARRLHQESEVGKFLDPICDKLSLAVILVTLFLIGAFPLWGLIVIVTRDVLILTGSFVIWRTHGKIFKSNMPGRIAGVLFGAMILAFTLNSITIANVTLNLITIGNVLFYISVLAVTGSFIVYLGRYLKTMKGVK
ncbi:hypothetical protein A2Y85_03445 [candidate division WOR-3 bacterium RBG_13_43_14]|uniref:CDP-diacylglycerol--glycerol-3-phosphate 3-phosphatidyltransferase n=1 Tax=candidate division WOR-3 bacterium RBG_13_43_14 TaxID=1802590 RepID=A0A1F4U2R3_UNCW3|nr:MAG: hypothetical protein A2Y85_03445 [candidate division WOR-3 bacterium RBG_13_43_14]